MSILKVNTIQDKGGNTLLVSDGAGTISSGGLMTSTPAFHAYGSGSNQTIPDQTATKVTVFNTEVFDSDNCFASNRFTPTVAGKYFVYCNLYWDTGTSNDFHNGAVHLRKNGSNFASITNNWNASGGNAMANHVGAVIDFNGSTDYVEVYCYQNTNSGNSDVFILKFNPKGIKQQTALLGTALDDIGYSVQIDSNNQIYLTGYTNGFSSTGDSNIFLVSPYLTQ